MRTLKHLLAGVLTVVLFTIYSPVKAGDRHDKHDDGSLYGGASDKWHDWNDDDKKGAGSGSGSSGGSSTNLPINDYVWALGIFAAALGVKIVTDKIKFVKD
ncbi:MAG: hypothetical protein V4577_18100 [Bacteroidota bacterium]